MNEKQQALIDALAGLGIKVPENTTFEGIISVMKQNKKLLKAHDAVVQAQTEGPSLEEDPKPGEGDPVDPPAKPVEDPKPVEEKDPVDPPEKETPPSIPPKKVIEDKPKEEDKPIKNKFVQQR